MATSQNLSAELAALHPELADAVEANTMADGEVLLTVALGDFSRWLQASVAGGDMSDIPHILGGIEKIAVAGDNHTLDVIGTGLIEMIAAFPPPIRDQVAPFLGPTCRGMLGQMMTVDIRRQDQSWQREKHRSPRSD